MIKNAEAHTNGAPPVPTRLAMNRLGPQKGPAAPPSAKKTAEANGQGDDIAQNRLTVKDYRLKAGRILWRLKVAVTAEAV